MKPSPIEHPDSPAPVSVARPQRSPSDCSLEAASVTEHTGHRSDESSKTRSVEPSPDGEHTPDGRLLKGLVDDEDQADADSKSRNGAYHDYAANTAATCHAAEVQLCTEARTQLHYRPTLILMGHKGGVSTVRFSPNGEKIASCSADGTIKIWNAATGQHQHTLAGHLAGVSTISWSPDSKLVASGSDDKSIRLWHATTGKAHPVQLLGHHNYVYSLAFSPKGNMLVSGSYDEAVFLWDIRAARVMRSLPAHSDPVSGVDFVFDGTLVTSCSSDGLIRIWDTSTGQCLRTLVHEDTAAVVSVRFSPNGRYVMAWTVDNCLRLWDYVEGRCVKTYQGHSNQKYSISGAFGTYDITSGSANKLSPVQCTQQAFIASGSEDGDIVLWDVSSKRIMQRLQGHDGPVLGVDTHPSQSSIVSCGMDGTVRIWQDDVT